MSTRKIRKPTPHPLLQANFQTIKNRTWGNWEAPEIHDVHDISEHFPVVLTPFHEEDGSKGYRITWHVQNLKDWRNRRAESWDEYLDYEDYVTERLRIALISDSEQFTILPTEHADELFRIEVHAVNRKKKTPSPPRSPPRSTSRSPPRSHPRSTLRSPPRFVPTNTPKKKTPTLVSNANIPKLFLLNDIKKYFPIVWHKNPHDPKLLGIQIHKANLQKMAAEANMTALEFEPIILARMEKALRDSQDTGAWQVLPSRHRDYVLVLRMLK